MDISFSCNKCGQSLTIDEAGAGQLVDCPKCGVPLEVPYKSEAVTPLPPAPVSPPPVDDTKTCPHCAEIIKRAARVCRFCGYDFATGQRNAAVVEQVVQQPVESVRARSGVWDGVKIGCGIFIVLPLLIILGLLGGCGILLKGCSEALKSTATSETTYHRPESPTPSFGSSRHEQTNATSAADTTEQTGNTKTVEGESSRITEAFGVALGTKVNLSAYTKDGIDRYQFAPNNPLAGMTNCYFKASPRTRLIYRVGAEGSCASNEVCTEKLNVLLSVLTKKYGAEEPQGFFDQMSDKHVIRSGQRSVTVKCTGLADITLELYYNDDALEKQANEEDMQIYTERVQAEKEAERR